MSIKKHGLMIGLFFITLCFSGCDAWENAYEQGATSSYSVVSIEGPAALGLVKAMEPGIKPVVRLGDTVQYRFEQEGEELVTNLLDEKLDIAIVPTELAAKLYNQGAGYHLVAINTGGFLYVLSNQASIKTISDLKGKVVQITGSGSPADVVFKYLLTQNGINSDEDLTIEYTKSFDEQVKYAMNKENIITVLPEPWVTKLLKLNSKFAISLDIQEEWKRINGSDMPLPLTCLIVKNEVVSENNKQWDFFLEDYKDSINWVITHPDRTAELLLQHDIGVPADGAEDVIRRSNLVFIDSINAKLTVQTYLNLFLVTSPEAIRGKLPDENFYEK